MVHVISRLFKRHVKRGVYGKSDRPASQSDISIIVPVLDEADNVLPLVERVRAALDYLRTEIIFIDDSLGNQTAEMVAHAEKLYHSQRFDVRVYHRTGDKRWGGLSGSVVDGIDIAGNSKIVIMDGDLQHPPETIPDMLDASMSTDIVVASRYCQGGSAKGLDGFLRHFVSSASTLATKIFFPLCLRNVSDPMTGFFLINRDKIDLRRLHPKGFKILLEILATHPKLSATEVPFRFAERNAGQSHGTIKQGLEFLTQLIQLRIRQFTNTLNNVPKPVMFGAIGGTVFVFGMLVLFVLVEIFGWSPFVANAIQLVITFWLNYMLNRNITWRERTVSRLAAHKFLVSRGATTILNYLLFALLISLSFSFTVFGQAMNFSVHYLAANVITLLAVTVINYVFSDRWAFAEAKPSRPSEPKQSHLPKYTAPAYIYLTAFIALLILSVSLFGLTPTFATLLATAGLVFFLQSSLEVWRMVYIYRQPESVDSLRFPTPTDPKERFCLIVPARQESAVIATTLQQLARQTHPYTDVIAVICDDDYETIQAAHDVATKEPRVKIIQYPLRPDEKPSKPKQLNYVLREIENHSYSVIGVIDAEDTVHTELLMHVDSAFRNSEIGVVQGGVQLMNHDSSWYSVHNVLEYYRWFNSAMAFQADSKFMPLGGNTIFIRETLLRKAGGWPETLTEDCSLGVLLSARYKAKTAVYYEPRLATREETPDTLRGLFKQRVRWNQGFFHEWRKNIWRDLPNLKQQLLANYILLTPFMLASVSLFIPASIISIVVLEVPVGLAMVMYLPIVPISLLLVLNVVFLHDFGKVFQRKILLRHYAMMIVTHIAYQVVLNFAAFWSVVRELRGEQSWYKTAHSGQHRIEPAPVYETVEVPDADIIGEGRDAT